MKKVAVILCGCGAMDGSEIHESVFTLDALDSRDISYQCFALDEAQARVMNFCTKTEMPESRNQKTEAARIARGDVLDINELDISAYDGLVIPGGFGVAYNLCNIATAGQNATVHPKIKAIIEGFYTVQKPIGAICISPALIALTLGHISPHITAGDVDDGIVPVYEACGATVTACSTDHYIADSQHKIYTTPAYMNAKRISDVRKGINAMIEAMSKDL